MAGIEQTTVEGEKMDIYVHKPNGSGPFPTVVLAFHKGGIDDFEKDRAERLAAQGFIAVIPGLFHRAPADIENPMTILDDNHLAIDLEATVQFVKAMPEADGRMAILGHCMGGRVAFLGASVNPAFSSAVVFYSGNMSKTWGTGEKPAFDLLSGIQGPVIGFFGNDDKNPSPEDVNKIDEELTKHGIAHEFHRYDGAGHAFQNFLADSYREEAEKDSWNKAILFLQKIYSRA